jgi:hypothetical protein
LVLVFLLPFVLVPLSHSLSSSRRRYLELKEVELYHYPHHWESWRSFTFSFFRPQQTVLQLLFSVAENWVDHIRFHLWGLFWGFCFYITRQTDKDRNTYRDGKCDVVLSICRQQQYVIEFKLANWRWFVQSPSSFAKPSRRVWLWSNFFLMTTSLHLLWCRHQYTVLINTWRRNDLLKKSVAHYTQCNGVNAIRVVWSEPEPPSNSLHLELVQSVEASNLHNNNRHNHKISFQFDTHETDDLNNRFKPLNGLHTDAIFSIDDDVVVPCALLEFSFGIWLSAPDSMVGFVPRMHWVQSMVHLKQSKILHRHRERDTQTEMSFCQSPFACTLQRLKIVVLWCLFTLPFKALDPAYYQLFWTWRAICMYQDFCLDQQ